MKRHPASVGFSRLPFCHQLELVDTSIRIAVSRLQPGLPSGFSIPPVNHRRRLTPGGRQLSSAHDALSGLHLLKYPCISGSSVIREWRKPLSGKPAEAGWDNVKVASFHQLKLVAKGESAEAD
jgi:hypothetical protein